jgi:hypothetical protein
MKIWKKSLPVTKSNEIHELHYEGFYGIAADFTQ